MRNVNEAQRARVGHHTLAESGTLNVHRFLGYTDDIFPSARGGAFINNNPLAANRHTTTVDFLNDIASISLGKFEIRSKRRHAAPKRVRPRAKSYSLRSESSGEV